MTTGYARASSGLIVTGQTIQASHFNNEYDAILAAFHATTGHNHDGTTGGGAPITALGTVATGVWNGTVITGTYGGTGVNNASRTITVGGALNTSGQFTTTTGNVTLVANGAGSNVTLPASGTLVNSAVTTLSSLTSVGTIATGVWHGTVVGLTYGGTGATSAADARTALSLASFTDTEILFPSGLGTTLTLDSTSLLLEVTSGGEIYAHNGLVLGTISSSSNYISIDTSGITISAMDSGDDIEIDASGFIALQAGASGSAISLTTTGSNGDIVASTTDGDITVTAAGTGRDVVITAADELALVGTGKVTIGGAALATNATTGHFWIPSCAGAPTGAATAPYTNAAGLIYDSTNNKLYVRCGGTWRATAALT